MLDRARLLHRLPQLSGKKSGQRGRSNSQGRANSTRRICEEVRSHQIIVVPDAPVAPILAIDEVVGGGGE